MLKLKEISKEEITLDDFFVYIDEAIPVVARILGQTEKDNEDYIYVRLLGDIVCFFVESPYTLREVKRYDRNDEDIESIFKEDILTADELYLDWRYSIKSMCILPKCRLDWNEYINCFFKII